MRASSIGVESCPGWGQETAIMGLQITRNRVLFLAAVLSIAVLCLLPSEWDNLQDIVERLAVLLVLVWGLDTAYSSSAKRLQATAAELRDSNSSLRALIEASPHAIFDLD